MTESGVVTSHSDIVLESKAIEVLEESIMNGRSADRFNESIDQILCHYFRHLLIDDLEVHCHNPSADPLKSIEQLNR